MSKSVNRGWQRALVIIRKRCEQLSQKQRRVILWSVSGVYLLLSLYMLIQPLMAMDQWQPVVVARDTVIETPLERIPLDSLLEIEPIEYLANK